jgi:predicted dehydrogenase
MLESVDIEMVSIATPHNTHAAIAIECLRAGKHVLVDKPMALSLEQCTAMIKEAKYHHRTLTVFHSRRHDGNYRAIKQTISKGSIGEVFHIECSDERYVHPNKSWYTDKEISGGALFFWGPHAIDWILDMVPSRLSSVMGITYKKVWRDVNIEDDIRATLLFENGTSAVLNYSTISCMKRPLWLILGTKGAIIDAPASPMSGATIPGYTQKTSVPSCGAFKLITMDGSNLHTSKVPYLESDWHKYYMNLAEHLLYGSSVPVSGEEGRRVIAVIEAIQKSARNRRSEPVPYE